MDCEIRQIVQNRHEFRTVVSAEGTFYPPAESLLQAHCVSGALVVGRYSSVWNLKKLTDEPNAHNARDGFEYERSDQRTFPSLRG